jgi:hypothetical protein
VCDPPGASVMEDKTGSSFKIHVITESAVPKEQCCSVGRSELSVMQDKMGNYSEIPVITNTKVLGVQRHSRVESARVGTLRRYLYH